MAKSKLVKTNEVIAEKVIGTYQKIEDTVVGGYTKIEDTFVDHYLTKDGETVEEAKKKIKARKCKINSNASKVRGRQVNGL